MTPESLLSLYCERVGLLAEDESYLLSLMARARAEERIRAGERFVQFFDHIAEPGHEQ